MLDSEKIEKLEKELSDVTGKYESLLEQFTMVFDHYEKGHKMTNSILTNIKMKDLFLPNYIKLLFNKMEESSKKIREDAIDGKIEFEEIRNDVLLSNYKELGQVDNLKKRTQRITDNLIYTDIQSNYDAIIKIVDELNIPENFVVVEKDLDTGSWTVINMNDSTILFEGKVNYKI